MKVTPRGLNPKAVQLAQTQQALRIAGDKPFVKCSECGGENFIRATKLKVIPGVALGQREDAVLYFGVYVCIHCNKVWEGPDGKGQSPEP